MGGDSQIPIRKGFGKAEAWGVRATKEEGRTQRVDGGQFVPDEQGPIPEAPGIQDGGSGDLREVIFGTVEGKVAKVEKEGTDEVREVESGVDVGLKEGNEEGTGEERERRGSGVFDKSIGGYG